MANDDDFGTVEAPEWKAGYAWTYDVSGKMNYDIRVPGEFMESGEVPIPTMKLQKEILNAGDFVHDGEPLYVGATTLPISHILDGSMFAVGAWADLVKFPTADRQRDLAPVPVLPSYDYDGGSTPEFTGLQFGQSYPMDYIKFPLEQGKRWDETVSLGMDLLDLEEMDHFGDVSELRLVAETGGMERIRLPVGNTDAVRIDFNYQPIGLERAVAQAREEIEAYGVTVDRLNVQLGLHEIVHYSPEYQAVVRDQYVLKALVDLVARSGDFQFEMFFDLSGYVLSEMSGAQLSEVPDYDMQGILDKLNGVDPIADPEGIEASVPSYSVELQVDRDRVNVARGDSFIVTAGHNADSLPAGHKLTYEVVDAYGVVAKEGDASGQFGVGLEEPGVYTVYLSARDQTGRVVTFDREVVYADFIATYHESCGAVDSFFYSDCGQIALPMREGLDHLVLTAKLGNGTLALLGQDRLELYAADGYRLATGQDEAGEYRIEMDGRDVPVAREDGYVTFVPEVALGDSVTYSVALVYGPSEIVEVVHEPTPGSMALTQDARLMGPVLSLMDGALEAAMVDGAEYPSVLGLF